MNANELERFSNTLITRMWRRVVVPGLGLQVLTLGLACGLANAPAIAWAQDPPAVAQLPDDGQPPAPATETTTGTVKTDQVEESATVVADEPAPSSQPETSEPPPAASSTDKSQSGEATESAIVAAEVTSDEQFKAVAPEVRELSVPPSEPKPLTPSDKPSWINQPPEMSNSVHRVFVGSSLADTPEEASAPDALNDQLIVSFHDYLDQLSPGMSRIQVPLEEIRGMIDEKSSYVLTLTTTNAVQFQKWVVLNVPKGNRERYQEQFKSHEQRKRMGLLGLGLVGLLGATGIANRAFTRRKKRYPTLSMPPATMPLLSALAGHDHNHAHAGAVEVPLVRTGERRRRSVFGKVVFLMIAVGMVAALAIPAVLTPVRIEMREAQRETFHEMNQFNHEMQNLDREIRHEIRQGMHEAFGR